MGKLKKCKTCGAQIAKSAKVCPSCGAKQHKGVNFLVGLICFIAVIAIISTLGKKSEPEKVGEQPDQAASSDNATVETNKTFGVGDQVKLNDIIVTLTEVKNSDGSEYNHPGDGNEYVLCSFTIENNSQKDIAVSSLVSFETYVDDYTTSMSLSAQLAADGEKQLDGTIAAGKKMNGVIGYEVSKEWKEIEIRLTPDFWAGEDITFVATNGK